MATETAQTECVVCETPIADLANATVAAEVANRNPYADEREGGAVAYRHTDCHPEG